MTIQRILVAVAAALLLYWGHRLYGWPGVAAVAGGLVMWLLLHVTRLMTVMQRAARRPIGHVDSAVMLNARLKPGVTLFHVVALTRALGERLSPDDAEPEIYRWRDPGGVGVEGEFAGGKLVRWQLQRPPAEAEAEGEPQGAQGPRAAP